MINIFKIPFTSRPAFIVFTVLQMLLPIASILVNIGRYKGTDWYNASWYFLGVGTATLLPFACAILVSSVRRKGKWPLRWGAMFILWSLCAFITALGFIAAGAWGDSFEVHYYHGTVNDPIYGGPTSWASSPSGLLFYKNYSHSYAYGIAVCVLLGISILSSLYYSIGLLAMRHTLPSLVCDLSGNPSSSSNPSNFTTLDNDDIESNNKKRKTGCLCGRLVRCCCCTMDTNCRGILLFFAFLLYFATFGGFSTLVIFAGMD